MTSATTSATTLVPVAPYRLALALCIALVFAGCTKSETRPDPTYAAALVTMQDVDDSFADKIPTRVDRVRVPYKAGDAISGAAQPLVTIVEFSDFQCPFCGAFAETLHEVQRAYPKDVRLVFKQFPLPMHPGAPLAAKAAIAAGAQHMFWAMHDWMFRHRTTLAREDLVAHAKTLGLDVAAFEVALDAPQTAERLAQEQALGRQLGVRGTPAFFINGRQYSGAMDPAALTALVEEERTFALALIEAGMKREEVYARVTRAARVPGTQPTP